MPDILSRTTIEALAGNPGAQIEALPTLQAARVVVTKRSLNALEIITDDASTLFAADNSEDPRYSDKNGYFLLDALQGNRQRFSSNRIALDSGIHEMARALMHNWIGDGLAQKALHTYPEVVHAVHREIFKQGLVADPSMLAVWLAGLSKKPKRVRI